MDERILKAVKEREKNKEIACAVAHSIAKELNVSPLEVGKVLDELKIKIVKCQLGLFGYGEKKKITKPPEKISDELKKQIEEELEEGRLPCKKAWDIAKRLGIKKIDVSSLCDLLGIKISKCQLGAF